MSKTRKKSDDFIINENRWLCDYLQEFIYENPKAVRIINAPENFKMDDMDVLLERFCSQKLFRSGFIRMSDLDGDRIEFILSGSEINIILIKNTIDEKDVTVSTIVSNSGKKLKDIKNEIELYICHEAVDEVDMNKVYFTECSEPYMKLFVEKFHGILIPTALLHHFMCKEEMKNIQISKNNIYGYSRKYRYCYIDTDDTERIEKCIVAFPSESHIDKAFNYLNAETDDFLKNNNLSFSIDEDSPVEQIMEFTNKVYDEFYVKRQYRDFTKYQMSLLCLNPNILWDEIYPIKAENTIIDRDFADSAAKQENLNSFCQMLRKCKYGKNYIAYHYL